MPKLPRKPIPKIPGVSTASEHFAKNSAGNPKPKRKEIFAAARPRRPANIAIAKKLAQIREMLNESATYLPPEVRAELTRIERSNKAGLWEETDLARIEKLMRPKTFPVKGPLVKPFGFTKGPKRRPGKQSLLQGKARMVSNKAVLSRASGIIAELKGLAGSVGIELAESHQRQLAEIDARINAGKIGPGDLQALNKIRANYIRKRLAGKR